MDLHEIFWHKKLTPKQLIVDWDKFILLFEQYIFETVSFRLNMLQKQYIKSLIDPENRNLVYKNSYLIFIKEFWDIPSNRTKLLKGNLNLSKVPKIKFFSDLKGQQTLLMKISYIKDKQNKQQNNECVRLKECIFEWKGDKIYQLNKKQQQISCEKVNCQNFLSIGSHHSNDIHIQNCSSLNPFHIKLTKEVIKPQKKTKVYSYQADIPQPSEMIKWSIRNISKSNQSQYHPTPYSYIIVHPSHVIAIGLIPQYELHILKATKLIISQQDIKNLNILLNNDRIDYMGNIDQNVREKVVLDINSQQVKIKDVQYWFNKGLKYQENQLVTINSNLQQKQDVPLILQLINHITQQKIQFKFFKPLVTVGRNKKCDIVIEKPTIRNIQCQFVCITGIWTLRNVQENCKDLENPTKMNETLQKVKNIKLQKLGIYLGTKNMMQNLTPSNRIKLPSSASHTLSINNLCITISFPHIGE